MGCDNRRLTRKATTMAIRLITSVAVKMALRTS